MIKRWGWLALFSLLVFSFTFHSAQTSWQQDLGRHLKIGQIIQQTKHIPRTNLFSYTQPDFPFHNHHWLAESGLYLIYSLFSNAGLVIFKTLIFLISLGLIYWFFFPKKINGAAALLALGPLLILRQRTQIRPELFGYLFFAAYLVIFKLAESDHRWLYLLPVLQVIWTNCHLSFIFGLFLIGLELVKTVFQPKNGVKKIIFLSAGCLAVLVNPFFVRGALQPLLIWQNYGYRIVENQSIFFLESLARYPNITIYKISFLLFLISFAFARRWQSWDFAGWLVLSAVAAWQIRHFPFWALFSLYCLGKNAQEIKQYFPRYSHKLDIPLAGLAGFLIVVISGFYLSGYYYRLNDRNRQVSYGGAQPAREAAEFLQDNFSTERIFNNFDIGSYLDWAIYPDMQVYTDSRPEAFPAHFWQRYRTVQSDWQEWEKLQEEYGIRVVFFSSTDQTPWGRDFLKNLYQNSRWQLVYWDQAALVFTRNGQEAVDLVKTLEKTQDPAALAVLGRFLQTIGQQELALKAWQKLLEINPASYQANIYLISAYRSTGNSAQRFQIQKLKNRVSSIWYKI